MGTRNEKMNLAAFVTAGPGRASGWLDPRAEHGWLSAAYYQKIGRILESGRFDLAFFPDILSVPNRYAGSIEGQVRYGALGSLRLDPVPILSNIAAVTEHLGLAATVSTSYQQPFHVARSFATRDHISAGRSAWNIVTSFQEAEARNFGRTDHFSREERYARADEFLGVAAKLWDSWAADALQLDRERVQFADPDRIRAIDHHGRWFDVQGPLNVPRPPQGWPVLIQAGASNAGRDFAARWADVIFCSHASFGSAQEFYGDVKARAVRHGRQAGDIRILPDITPVIGRTSEEAQQRKARLAELVPDVAGLSTLAYHLDIDLSQFPLDEYLPSLANPSIVGHYEEVVEITRREGLTLRQLGKQYGGRTEGNFIGTAPEIADGLERWFNEGAADGFTVTATDQPGAFEEFASEVVPELQRRGLLRTDYEGRTLRDNLGLAVPQPGAWRERVSRER
ncbi:LLM class flavin-dependent oxidoreductase [Xylophilus sp.]|uniref:LLM class flavin-dependent oxidoreductase n=1 Tax=Xylophilus sp. TaxID=2653893 RepID=UPI0013B948F7|nr:LLM class flavin-dependent oxidoreductase [Xylophilus sp.]KAF1047912.1 MAG: Nitrilotriacetate monooxygenase component A [Xylophilus sp.]